MSDIEFATAAHRALLQRAGPGAGCHSWLLGTVLPPLPPPPPLLLPSLLPHRWWGCCCSCCSCCVCCSCYRCCCCCIISVMLLALSLAVRALSLAAAAAAPPQFELSLLDQYPNAKCLDGCECAMRLVIVLVALRSPVYTVAASVLPLLTR